MAITVATSPQVEGTTTPLLTNSMTVAAGDYVALSIATDANGSTLTHVASKSSGTATIGTPVLQGSYQQSGGQHCHISVPVTGSGTLVLAISDIETRRTIVRPLILTGVDTGNPYGFVAQGGSSTNSINVGGTALTTGITIVGGTEWNDLGNPTSSDLSNFDADNGGGASMSYGAGWKVTAAGAVTGNLDAAGTGTADWDWVAVEYRAGAIGTAEQEGFRWRNDDGDEDAATWRQTQDTSDDAEIEEQIRLRVLLNTTNDLVSTQFQLEYKQDSQTWYRPIGIGYPGTLPAVTSATGTADNVAGTTVAAAYPAVVGPGDLLIFVVAKDDDATGITDTTGGLNVIGNGNTGSGADGVCLFAGWMIAAGTEDGTTRTFTGDSEEFQTFCIRILAGAFDASNPIDGASVLNGSTAAEAITAAFTCVRPGGLVIACGAVDVDPMDATFSPSGWTDVADNAAGQVTAWVSTRNAATTVAETIASATFGINTNDANVALAFVVNAPLGTAEITHVTSTHYADGDTTTFQLTAPSGKSTSDFDAGVMVEGQALADAVDITTDDYTEIEWALKAQSPAVLTEPYQFRVTANGTPITTYTIIPELTLVTGGSTELVVADMAVGSTIDSLTLTQHHVLVVADMASSSTIDNVGLTQHHVLVVADMSTGSTFDALSLTQHHHLVVADATCASTFDSVSLVQDHVLVIADMAVAATLDNVTLSQHHTLVVADFTSASIFDNIVLGVAGALSVNEFTAHSTFDSVTLLQDHILVVADFTSASIFDALVLLQHHHLIVADFTSASTFDAVVLGQHHALTVADSFVGALFDNVTLGVQGALVVADYTVGSTFDSVLLSQDHQLVVLDLIAGTQLDAIVLTQHHVLGVVDLSGATTWDNAVLGQQHVLIVDDMTVTCLFDMIIFAVAVLTTLRVYCIKAESRTHDIEAEDRLFCIVAENRTLTVEAP